MSGNSQAAEILGVLLSGRRLTPIDALGRFGCFRLGARIFDLRCAGYRIERDMIESDGKRFACYYMTPEAMVAAGRRHGNS